MARKPSAFAIPRRRSESGYTLFEIMIVIALIALLASFAIPAMSQARMAANETSALAMVRAIFDAQTQFRNQNPAGNYASGLFDLQQGGMLPSGLLFNGAEGANTGEIYERAGYEYASTVSTADGGLLIVAQPVVLNVTGTRSYLERDDGTILERVGFGFTDPTLGKPVAR